MVATSDFCESSHRFMDRDNRPAAHLQHERHIPRRYRHFPLGNTSRYNRADFSPLFEGEPHAWGSIMAWTLLGLRWSARITGLLLVGLVVIFMVGEGPPNPFRQPPPVQLELLSMGLMLVGFVVGWRREGLGSLLAVIGFAIFAASEMIVSGRPPGGAIPIFAVPGVLYLTSYGVGRWVKPCRENGFETSAQMPQHE